MALAGLDRQLAPIANDDPQADQKDAMLSGEIMRASMLLSPHLEPRLRADWVSAVMAELEIEPFELVIEAIALARRSCKHPADFVPSVVGVVVPRKARLQAQRDRLETIIDAAT